MKGLSKQRLWGFVAAVAVLAFAGQGPASAQELNAEWDHCGASGAPAKNFTCGTNAGSDTLVVSLVSPFNLARVAHANIRISVCFSTFAAPDWWQVLGAGGCRAGALAVTGPAPSDNCAQLWDPVSGSTQSVSFVYPNVANGLEFILSVAAADTTRLTDVVIGQETEVVRLVLGHMLSAGTGACAGCAAPARIGADVIWLYSTDGRNIQLAGGAAAAWQAPSPSCTAYVPVRNHTWGELKSLYR